MLQKRSNAFFSLVTREILMGSVLCSGDTERNKWGKHCKWVSSYWWPSRVENVRLRVCKACGLTRSGSVKEPAGRTAFVSLVYDSMNLQQANLVFF